MARQLIRAAKATGDTSVPGADNISHNIYRWERGAVAPAERYKLYYCGAFGIPFGQFGSSPAAGLGRASPTRRAWSTLALGPPPPLPTVDCYRPIRHRPMWALPRSGERCLWPRTKAASTPSAPSSAASARPPWSSSGPT